MKLALAVPALCLACGQGIDPAPQLPDDAAAPPDAQAAAAVVLINELMATNVVTVPSAGDWIELYNRGPGEVHLSGWSLTDNLAHPGRFSLEDAVLAPGGYLLVTLPSTALAREGGQIGLATSDGRWTDRVTYGEQAVDFSAARTPDGSDAWQIVWNATPGASNGDGPGAPAAVEDPTAPPEAVPAAGDVSERLLGEGAFPAFELVVPPESVTSLEASPRVWAPATLLVGGRAIDPVAVRLKGENSFRPFSEKPSLKIKVDEYLGGAEAFGLEELTLNNMHNDPSMMHERVAYWFARRAGVPCSRATHATLVVNGADYGLYANVETVTARLLSRWFAQERGPLFEGVEADFVRALVPLYEHEAGPDDRTLLFTLADALALPDGISQSAATLDWPAFRRFWAVSGVIGQFDGYPFSQDDYHVYADPTSGRLAFLPWGMDETYTRWWREIEGVTAVVARVCLESDPCRQSFHDEVWAAQDLAEELDVGAMIEEVAAEIAPYTVADGRKASTDAEVAAAQEAMRQFVSTRRHRLSQQIGAP